MNSASRHQAPRRVRSAWARCLVVGALLITFGTTLISGSLEQGGSTTGAPSAARSSVPHAVTEPILGLLGASTRNYAEERAAGIDSVTVQASWNSSEPSQGIFSTSYVEQVEAEIAAARAVGLSVVLDPGLQYAPAWVFGLAGGTQFVDQYGDVFTGPGPSGDDVANAVTDTGVRSAEGIYLEWLGSQIPPGDLIAVRGGGGPLGELRYPDADYNGHSDTFWAYDASTQSDMPASVRGWTPGTGSVVQATTFLTAYNEAIDGYGIWLDTTLQADFDTKVLLMLPGWGERPGGAATEEESLLAPASAMDEFNEGLDWVDLLSSLPDAVDTVAYTTYLDAATVDPTVQLEDPADYLASLVAGTPILLGGENTGDGTVSTLALCVDRAQSLDFWIFDWMDETQLLETAAGTDPGGPTFAQLGASFSASGTEGWSSLTVTHPSLPAATERQAYAASLTATGGDPLYAWSVSSGSLPPGLSLNASSGTIAGTPTAAGRWSFNVQVQDAVGDTAQSGFAITVSAGAGPDHLAEPVVGVAATPDGGGYWIANAAGGVESFGDAPYFGSMSGSALVQPINHIVSTPDGGGYWLVAADGGIFSFGDAAFFGSMGGKQLDAPIVDLAPTPDGGGYWLVGADGGIFSFGDAAFFGSMGGRRLNRPIVGIAADPATGGYWEVATDGGVFAFGAPFYGSTGDLTLNKPINGMAVAGNGAGYWFVASDGGVFAFGRAPFHGSVGGTQLNAPVVGMGADPASGGYWLVAADGGVFTEGAPFFGAG